MRCPECNKFVGYDDSNEPEVTDELEINEDGRISGTVRVVLVCAEDGSTELKEATFDIDYEPTDFAASEHQGEGHELSVEQGNISLESRTQTTVKKLNKKTGQMEETPIKNPRYFTTFYGFSLDADIMCECSKEALKSVTITDEIQASSMDECV